MADRLCVLGTCIYSRGTSGRQMLRRRAPPHPRARSHIIIATRCFFFFFLCARGSVVRVENILVRGPARAPLFIATDTATPPQNRPGRRFPAALYVQRPRNNNKISVAFIFRRARFRPDFFSFCSTEVFSSRPLPFPSLSSLHYAFEFVFDKRPEHVRFFLLPAIR